MLLRQALEDHLQLAGGMIDRVIELRLVDLAAFFVAKGLLAEIGDAPVHIQIGAVEIVQFARELKDFRAHRQRPLRNGCGSASSLDWRMS